MNIHFDNIDLFKKLLNSTIFKIEVGSKMYGISDSSSDTDILCIYAASETERNSFLFSHHQLQYKDVDNNTDYIFTNIHNFLRNSINGDSTINFEVINSQKLINSELSFLYENRKSFFNYKIIRSYLGFGRRDIKQYNEKNNERDKNKKLIHAYRSLIFAKSIRNETFNLSFSEEELNEIKKIKDITDFNIRKAKSQEILENINNFREHINKEYEQKLLINNMKVENQLILDKNLNSLLISDFYISKKMYSIDMSLFYDAFENDITY